MKAKKIESQYKIIMIGDAGAGKTSLLLKFTDNVFDAKQPCTVSVDFKVKVVRIDNKAYKLQLWDTVG